MSELTCSYAQNASAHSSHTHAMASAVRETETEHTHTHTHTHTPICTAAHAVDGNLIYMYTATLYTHMWYGVGVHCIATAYMHRHTYCRHAIDICIEGMLVFMLH